MYCEGMELRRESGNDVATDTHLFGVLEVLEEGLLVPGDALVDVGGGVGEALGLSGLATEHTARATSTNDRIVRQHRYSPVEVRADLVGSASLEGMALSAAGLEETSTLASVTCDEPNQTLRASH